MWRHQARVSLSSTLGQAHWCRVVALCAPPPPPMWVHMHSWLDGVWLLLLLGVLIVGYEPHIHE